MSGIRVFVAATAITATFSLPWLATGQTIVSDVRPSLDDRIGPPDEPKIAAICSDRDWRNPLITINADGSYTLRSLSILSPKMVAADSLQSALIALPVTDWPYGRIVAVPRRGELPTPFELAQQSRIGEAILPLRVGWWIWPHESYCVQRTPR